MHVKYPPISTVPANGSTIQNAFDAADMELHVGQNGLVYHAMAEMCRFISVRERSGLLFIIYT